MWFDFSVGVGKVARVSGRPGRLLDALVAALAARGVDPSHLLAVAQVDPAQLDDPDAELPTVALQRLWHEAPRLTDDDDFGLHLAEQLQAHDLGGLGFAVRSSSTLGESYGRIARYFRLVHPEAGLEVIEAGHRALVRHVPASIGIPPRHAAEFTLGVLTYIGRREAGAPFRLREVRFSHAQPDRLDEHLRTFACTVRFEQPHNELELDREALALPFVRAEPALCEVLDRHLQELIAKLPSNKSFLDRVRAALVDELRDGEPTLERLAERLHTSERSLQRHLQREGSSLQALLAEVRTSLAIRYLTERRESIAEVAFLLGFSEVSTFHRAFKRWTGETPAAYRRSTPAHSNSAS